MDSILEPQVYFISDDNETESLTENEHISLWVIDKDKVRPSTNISLTSKLDPQTYIVGYERDTGFYCQKAIIKHDELFVFSNSLTQKLTSEIDLFWSKAESFAEKKLLHKRGVFIEGVSGTGKTSLITQLTEKIIQNGGVVFIVQNFKNLSDYVEFMVGAFRKIQPDTPVVTIIEDIDKYEAVESELLDFLDGKTNINHHVIIATSNNTAQIPDTILRPSRFDMKIILPLPDETTRLEYFQFKNVQDARLLDLVKLSDGCSLAELKEIYICIYLLDYTIEDAVTKVKSPRTRKNYLFKAENTSKVGF